jgi:glycosyltransferase involved in cell wall biosynthesis
MAQPLVSVCLISCNHRRYIGQALESILMQETVFPFEIIAGDDCSDDGTAQALDGYRMQTSGRVQILPSPKRLGVVDNVLRTLSLCSGRYVALIEGDDYWTSPRKLQKQVDLMERHPDTTVCFHDALVMNEEAGLPSHFAPEDQKEVSTLVELLSGNFIPTASVMYRRLEGFAFPEVFKILPTVDWPLHALHAEKGTIRFIDEVMSVYRLHSASAWNSRGWRHQTESLFLGLDAMNKYFSVGALHRTAEAKDKLLGARIREATIRMNIRDFDQAAGMLYDVLYFRPDLHEIRLARAFALVQINRLQDATRELEDLLRRKPDHAGALALLDKIYCTV